MKRKLNDAQIKHASCKPEGKPLNLTDGGGLYLHIKQYCKSWRYNPWIGPQAIGDIKRRDIINIMLRVEDRGAGDAARRVKGWIRDVYKYAVTMEITENNPAATIDNNTILQPRVKQHYATIKEPETIGRLLNDIDHYQGSFYVKSALKLSPLVMLRPGELRAAEWSEIDLEKAVWTIPIKRMKAATHIKRANQSAHVVPLSRQAVEILRELYPVSGRFKFVFPNHRGASRAMSDNAVRSALRTMGYSNQEITPHGFRGMASTLLNEMGVFNPDAIERQLAHQDRDRIRAAYNRAEYLKERREMLQVWADKLDEFRAAGRAA